MKCKSCGTTLCSFAELLSFRRSPAELLLVFKPESCGSLFSGNSPKLDYRQDGTKVRIVCLKCTGKIGVKMELNGKIAHCIGPENIRIEVNHEEKKEKTPLFGWSFFSHVILKLYLSMDYLTLKRNISLICLQTPPPSKNWWVSLKYAFKTVLGPLGHCGCDILACVYQSIQYWYTKHVNIGHYQV